MTQVDGGATAPPPTHDMARPKRRRPIAFPAQGVGGKLLIAGRGRITGWALFDTQGLGSVPAAGNILTNHVAGAGTLLTIPANTAWYGSIFADAEQTVAPGGAAGATSAVVTTAAGLVPSNLNLIVIHLNPPASGSATATGTVDHSNGLWGPGWIINPTGGPLNVTTGGAAQGQDTWASGVTLPYPGGLSATVVELYDGGDATGQLLAPIAFPQGTSVVEALGDDGPDFSRGLFLNVISGTVRGAVWMVDDRAGQSP